VVLSVVALSGISGIRAVFLGGVLMGYLIEGVVVDELYLAFPFQLIWTSMAWHALITSVCIFGLGRVAPFWPLWRHLLALVLLGMFGATFASFWPSERGTMPAGDLVLFYLAGVAFVVPAAHLLLDRIGQVPRPPTLVLVRANDCANRLACQIGRRSPARAAGLSAGGSADALGDAAVGRGGTGDVRPARTRLAASAVSACTCDHRPDRGAGLGKHRCAVGAYRGGVSDGSAVT